jgi:hypothetical protein
MSTDAKSSPPRLAPRPAGVRIFTYPSTIFLMPTLITALVCGIVMMMTGDRTVDPTKSNATEVKATTPETTTVAPAPATTAETPKTTSGIPINRRFGTFQNFLAVAFMVVFGLNILIMSVDFPRFTVIALVLGFAAIGFFILWLNVYFELLPPIVRFLEHFFLVANAGFYFALATILILNFGVIFVTRYLDYWEVMPNEILHNHGPFSDLERFPTMNLKFDKEIPDILEYALLRSGRLVMHIPGQNKAIVLNNVLWINTKEEALKKLLSRMEVRVTTDQEAANETM